MDLEAQVVMRAKDWLEQEEWENVAVDSQKFSHYTTLDKILEEYAKVYLKNKSSCYNCEFKGTAHCP